MTDIIDELHCRSRHCEIVLRRVERRCVDVAMPDALLITPAYDRLAWTDGSGPNIRSRARSIARTTSRRDEPEPNTSSPTTSPTNTEAGFSVPSEIFRASAAPTFGMSRSQPTPGEYPPMWTSATAAAFSARDRYEVSLVCVCPRLAADQHRVVARTHDDSNSGIARMSPGEIARGSRMPLAVAISRQYDDLP